MSPPTLRTVGMAALALLIFVCTAAETSAQTTDPGTAYEFVPHGDLYKPYIADPHRVRNSGQIIGMVHNDIPDTGDFWIGLNAGGRFGIVRIHPTDLPELGWQFSFEAGADFLFDQTNQQDNIGWDGNFGLYLTHAIENGWSFKLATLHTSSHIGDEYMQRTGRLRIDYTREELALAVSKQFNPNYRAYGEGGVAYYGGNSELQDPGRLQAGFEMEYPNIFGGPSGWYTALDLQSWQERDWKLDAALQTGLYLPDNERMYRVGIEFYRGRPTVGEFFQSTDSQISFGVWIDI